MKKMDKKAFTLIELIVVVAVVGILVLLGMPRFIGYKDKAELARIQHDVKVMEQEIGTVLINNDDDFNKWESSSKDFNQLIQEGRLFEKEGIANKVESIDKVYKVIPAEYKDKINTKLKGTFYTNNNGKVYYEHEKPLLGIPTKPEEKEPVYSDEEIDDLVKIGFIPVATVEDLDNIRNDEKRTYGKGTKWVSEHTGGLDKQYVQVVNIDLSGYSEEGWNPIGTYVWDAPSPSFTGTYDGGNYVIRGLEVKGEGKDYQGLFGLTDGATIRNVGLIDNTVTGSWDVGGLVGKTENGTTISNSYATGSVTGEDRVGGLVGQAYGGTNISNSYITGSVEGGGSAGGLVGEADESNISNSYATGSVTGTSSRVGGLVGGADDSTTISNSYATGEVTGTSSVGGLVGQVNWYITINNSYATGSVTGTSSRVGGLVGDTHWDITINNSSATGSVTGSDLVGGLVGYAGDRTEITNSYAIGSVEGSGFSASAGGLVGQVWGSSIKDSYATGSVERSGSNEIAGGLVGEAVDSTIENSYATGSVEGSGFSAIAGGLVGKADESNISNSYATGSVESSGSWAIAGGLVGQVWDSSIKDSYATGSVTGTEDVGGLVGEARGTNTISNSYWNTETTGQEDSAGQVESFGKSTNDMKSKDTYSGWDFDTVWKIEEGKDYPKLR